MKRTLALISCAMTLAFVGGTTLISAENGQKAGKATVRAVHGTVSYTVNGGQQQKLHVNQTLEQGATVITGPDSYADVSVNGLSSVVRIQPDTKLDLSKMLSYGGMNGDKETFLDLQAGEILGNVRKISAASRYEIQTPHGVAGIRGTDFQITIKLQPSGELTVTFTSVKGDVTVSAMVNGAPVVHNLTTGMSWTPGSGEPQTIVIPPPLIRVFNQIAGLLNIEQLPPPPGPHNPFPTGGQTQGNETTP